MSLYQDSGSSSLVSLDTKTPTPSPIADSLTTPAGNIQSVGAANLGFNGSSWDRLRSGLTTAQTTFIGLLNTISLNRYNATLPTLTDGNVIPNQVDVRGRNIARPRSIGSNITTVAATTTSTIALAASTTSARVGVKIVNTSTSVMYGLYGTGTASATNCSFVLSGAVGGVYSTEEVPYGYEGQITTVWVSATGSCIITEFI